MIPHSKPTISEADNKSVSSVLQSQFVTQGSKVELFEAAFKNYLGVSEACALSTGTAALHLSLLSMDICKGDEVIIPSFVCSALLNAINYTGATPVLADVNLEDFNMCAKSAKKKVTKKTKAIIVPHMLGMPADIDALLGLGIPIIEDCAQAIGATYNGQVVGTFSNLAVFSFYGTKMLTTGEGGMVTTNDKTLACKILNLRQYDNKPIYNMRYNYKMSDIQAALGISQINHLSDFIKRRREIEKIYFEELNGTNLKLPARIKGRESVFYRYVVLSKNADKLVKNAKKQGVECVRMNLPLHKQLGLPTIEYENAEKIGKESVSIPIYPSLSDEYVKRIVEVLK